MKKTKKFYKLYKRQFKSFSRYCRRDRRSASLMALIILISFLAMGAANVRAAARYYPGQTLTPDCGPTDPDCTVSSPLYTSASLDIGSSPQAGYYTATSTTATSVLAGGLSVAGTAGLTVLPSGNVGIGTTSPYATLSIEGFSVLGNSATAGYFTATSTTATSTFAGGMSVAGASGLTVLQNGNVGIGTTSPQAALDMASGGIRLGGVTRTQWTAYDGLISQIVNIHWDQTVAVSPGNGTITAALNAITDNGPIKRYKLYLANGTYNDVVTMKSYVDIVGQSQTEVIIQHSSSLSDPYPDSGVPGNVNGKDTIYIGGENAMLANVTVNHTRNIGDPGLVKYPIHADGGNDSLALTGPTMIIYNVTTNNLGTEPKSAIGIGLEGANGSYQRIYLLNSTFNSPVSGDAIYSHGHINTSDPTAQEIYVINSVAIAANGNGFEWQNSNAAGMSEDKVFIAGGKFRGAGSGRYDIYVSNGTATLLGAGESWQYVDPYVDYVTSNSVNPAQFIANYPLVLSVPTYLLPNQRLYSSTAITSQSAVNGNYSGLLISNSNGVAGNSAMVSFATYAGNPLADTAEIKAINNSGSTQTDLSFLVHNGSGLNEGLRVSNSTAYSPLLIASSTNAGGNGGTVFIRNGAASTLNNSATLAFGVWKTPTATSPNASIKAINTNSSTGGTDLAYSTTNNTGQLFEVQRMTRFGNVGIGTTSPMSKFSIFQSANTVAGGISLSSLASSTRSIYMDDSNILHFSGNGTDGTLNASGVWTDSSDIAYKNNIIDMKYGLTDLLRLEPKQYTMKVSGIPQIGLIAQDVEKVIPEVVSGEEGHKGIAYGQLTALLIQAVKEISTKLDNFIAKGIANIKNLVVDLLTAKKVQTAELCVDDVCIDKTQLKSLLQNANLSGVSPDSTPTPTPTPPSTSSGQASPTPTPEAIAEPEITPTPTPAPSPTPTPEPTPTPTIEPTPSPSSASSEQATPSQAEDNAAAIGAAD